MFTLTAEGREVAMSGRAAHKREKREAPDIFRTRTPIPPDTHARSLISPPVAEPQTALTHCLRRVAAY